MNTLRENSNTSNISPHKESPTMSAPTVTTRPKAALKKEELEKIAKQLKKKLSKASIAAKQSLSPTDVKTSTSMPRSSPLKSYSLKKQYSGSAINNLSSSPNTLCSPTGKSPTHLNTPAAIYLSSSPLRNMAADSTENDESLDSPTKRRKTSPRMDSKGPHMVLEEIQRPNTPSGSLQSSLKPSLELTAADAEKNKKKEQPTTTPTLAKRELHGSPPSSANILLQTPKQSRANTNGGAYNDEEGADLLMYLATSPSPAKPYFSNSARPIHGSSQIHPTSSSVPNSSGSLSLTHKPTMSAGSSSSFILPPPVTPKRHSTINSKTPQNRLTPSMNLFNNLNGNTGLPSSGLTLTPTGFNMNDYVNFFTPSPGGTGLNKNLLRTPDFNNLLNGQPNTTVEASGGVNGRPKVDGKMLNFNKVLFSSSANGPEGNAKE
ncbi:predicted protein [Scheffersomyces stipitis CBS 6054]|uniref:Uncharacterized protein n=1 Tax=Scheffersomyces stipitis (strain ATCC 58785 / CBS 6054 / NBRC 10063 / NRRL Y-11545) TaxID=322104 RepID=A3LTA8_PICST|nr:predicted protein [Scheffersomyces stipitis CBS 6054]ABN66038.2 predicted protein [Scheffersomyces stipitis CBS 6054]